MNTDYVAGIPHTISDMHTSTHTHTHTYVHMDRKNAYKQNPNTAAHPLPDASSPQQTAVSFERLLGNESVL